MRVRVRVHAFIGCVCIVQLNHKAAKTGQNHQNRRLLSVPLPSFLPGALLLDSAQVCNEEETARMDGDNSDLLAVLFFTALIKATTIAARPQ